MGCLEQHTKSPKKSQLRNIFKKPTKLWFSDESSFFSVFREPFLAQGMFFHANQMRAMDSICYFQYVPQLGFIRTLSMLFQTPHRNDL